jgi:hypothetical protein
MGILASSSSVTMTSSSSDAVSTGYVIGEQISLTTNPTGTTYAWSSATPSGSAAARSALSATAGANVKFTPDADGVYVVSCTVDSATTYVIRLTVVDVAFSTVTQVVRLSPVEDNAVPAPATGRALYFSATHNAVVLKDPSNTIFVVDTTEVP